MLGVDNLDAKRQGQYDNLDAKRQGQYETFQDLIDKGTEHLMYTGEMVDKMGNERDDDKSKFVLEMC